MKPFNPVKTPCQHKFVEGHEVRMPSLSTMATDTYSSLQVLVPFCEKCGLKADTKYQLKMQNPVFHSLPYKPLSDLFDC